MIKNKLLLPIIILVVFIVSAKIITSNPPSTKRGKPSQASQLNVDVQTVKPKTFDVSVHSYGVVKPRTQSTLLPQVSGQILKISDNFREGGFFEAGDILLELDDRDLKAELDIAKSNLFNAKQALSEEQARVAQAKQDWKLLGKGEEAPDLVLRKPQLSAVQARLLSAQASLTKTELSLERSKIKAPFTGRILSKEVDVGQVISLNTQLAKIYAVDYVEIRLPIKNKDLAYMHLPENSRVSQVNTALQSDVTIISNLVSRQSWQGKIVRTEGAFDNNSQQLFVVAQIDDPYGVTTAEGLPLKIGQYVTAIITGKSIEEAIVIPNKAIYQGSFVYVVENDLLKRLEVDIAWQDEKFSLLKKGFQANQFLVITPLGQVNSGTRVKINSTDGKKIQPTQRKKKPAHRLGPDKAKRKDFKKPRPVSKPKNNNASGEGS